jgi:hypothetical protein
MPLSFSMRAFDGRLISIFGIGVLIIIGFSCLVVLVSQPWNASLASREKSLAALWASSSDSGNLLDGGQAQDPATSRQQHPPDSKNPPVIAGGVRC